MEKIPEAFVDLFKKKAYAHVATLMADGRPQVSPVWVDYDGEYVIMNTARGRIKDKNMTRDKRVALSIQDPEDPYRYLMLQGEIVKSSEEGANKVIDSLAKKYLGLDRYPSYRPGEVRITYWIAPLKIHTSE
jgi:PPOX class probable F420-dependent enzyme